MTACAGCGADNPDGFRFCGACGRALPADPCLACGFVNPPGQRFCGGCGAAVGTTTAARGAVEERKLATVLFADVVGFTTLAEGADPEAVARTVDGAFRRLSEIVTEHGGTVDKYMGDCLMAVFGVPQSHEDDAERAVAAALAMREAGGDLTFSIGVNTGEVMVTSVGREGAPTVIGDAVNVAARLEKAAGPGTVLVGALTAELAGDRILLAQREPLVLKGKREPVAVFEALGTDEAAFTASAVPLVGRLEELELLLARWRRSVRERRPEVVRVVGEAGSGKTRLVEALAAAVESQAALVRTAYPAYGGLGGPRVAADVVRALGSLGDHRLDERLASLTGEVPAAMRDLDAAAFRQEQVMALRRLLETRAADRPLLLAVDDMHRAREQAIDIVAETMARVADAPVMLVLAGRPEPDAWLTRFPTATTVHVDALAPQEATALAASFATADGRSLDAAALDAIVDRAGGNPLHLRELARLVIGGADAPALPPSLQAVLAARLDALPPAEKGTLQVAALLGDDATGPQLEALGAAPGAVSRLVTTGLVRCEDDGRHRVADPLLREVAYEMLSWSARGALHRRAAEAAASPEERTRHLELAATHLPGDAALAAEAASSLAATGRDLLARHRTLEGIRMLDRATVMGVDDPATVVALAKANVDLFRIEPALALLDSLPAQTGDARLDAERIHVRANALGQLRPLEALALFDDAAARWRALGDVDKEAWALSNKGVALFVAGRTAESAHCMERAVDRFEAAGDSAGVLSARLFVALGRPEDPRVVEWMEEALADADASGDLSRRRNALIALAWHHYVRSRGGGDADSRHADDVATALATTAEEIGDHRSQAMGLALRALMARDAGRIDDAAALAARAAAIDGVEPESGTARLVRAAAYVTALAGGDAAPPAGAVSPSSDPIAFFAVAAEADALILAGRPADALERLRDLGRMLDYTAVTVPVAGGATGLANILLGRHEQARPLLEAALAAARVAQAGAAGAGAAALLAEVAWVGGDHDGARRALAEARAAGVGGVASGLVERATVVVEGSGEERLRETARHLAAPGLLLGVGATPSVV